MRRAVVFISPVQRMECTIHNISRAGAMLEFEQEVQLPKRFLLDMSGNIAVKRVCELVWQDGLHAGVKFPLLKKFESIQFGLP